MRFSGYLTIGALGGALLVAAGPGRAADAVATDPPSAAVQAAPTVTVAPAAIARVRAQVPLSGTLVARQMVQINPQVAGFEIVELNAEAGDRVVRGQVLARLSDTTLRAQLSQAEAELLRAEAGVGQANSQIASAEAALTQAVAALGRARQLRQSGSGTQASLDQAVASEAAARAAAASARDGLAVAQAARAQAAAARDIARLNVDRTVIAAPVDGLITRRDAELGALSGAAAAPLFTLLARGEVELKGEVIETALPDLRLGQSVELNVAGVGSVTGTVRMLPASVDATTRLGEVRIALAPDDRLRPGLFASGAVVTAERDAVTVPATAVLADNDGERVQVVRDGVVETRPVRAGLLWQGRREITEGIQSGEQVIVRAGAFFRTGDAVRAVAAEEGALPPRGAVVGEAVGIGGGTQADAPPAAGAAQAAEARAVPPAVQTPASLAERADARAAERAP